MTTQHIETLIIGAGQAGLATAYHLQKRHRGVLIVDRNGRIGDNWREHYDSLRLYTPARYNGLPGLPFRGPIRGPIRLLRRGRAIRYRFGIALRRAQAAPLADAGRRRRGGHTLGAGRVRVFVPMRPCSDSRHRRAFRSGRSRRRCP